MALSEAGRPAEALALNQRAIDILRKALGAGHPEVAMHISNRGEILNALGRYEEARALFNSALAVWNKELPPDHSDFGDSLNGIGASYLGQDEPEPALAPLERALAIREKSGAEPSQIGETRFLLARALWDSGRDRARAATLAQAAKSAYGDKAPWRDKVDAIDRWLAQHPVAPRPRARRTATERRRCRRRAAPIPPRGSTAARTRTCARRADQPASPDSPRHCRVCGWRAPSVRRKIACARAQSARASAGAAARGQQDAEVVGGHRGLGVAGAEELLLNRQRGANQLLAVGEPPLRLAHAAERAQVDRDLAAARRRAGGGRCAARAGRAAPPRRGGLAPRPAPPAPRRRPRPSGWSAPSSAVRSSTERRACGSPRAWRPRECSSPPRL